MKKCPIRELFYIEISNDKLIAKKLYLLPWTARKLRFFDNLLAFFSKKIHECFFTFQKKIKIDSSAKINHREILEDGSSAKINPREMLKFRG